MKITNLYPESQQLEVEVIEFLKEWNNDETYVLAQTSGSTGTPKTIRLEKGKMIASAKMTGEFFDLKNCQTALLVLSPKFIAGKMMVVRSLIFDLELYIGRLKTQAISTELPVQIDFAAMIPTQVKELLSTSVSFDNIKHLIIGGSPMDNDLLDKLSLVSTSCYATFGMTETISHFALAKVGEGDLRYKTLPGITINLDSKSRLEVEAPALVDDKLSTNDIVELFGENEFVWKGRFDHVINSGGIKIFPELVEQKLSSFIDCPFFIAGETDDKFGERVVLYIESKELVSIDFDALDKYEIPKKTYNRTSFVWTDSGKINRLKTIERSV